MPMIQMQMKCQFLPSNADDSNAKNKVDEKHSNTHGTNDDVHEIDVVKT